MLSFYTIDDEAPMPSNPAQQTLTYAGELDELTFEHLKTKGIIPERFDYYSHFRLGTQLIEQIRQIIQKKDMKKDNNVQSLLTILDMAKKQKRGIVAYGD